MGYIIAMVFIIGGLVVNEPLMFIAAGCFAISGSIAYHK